MNTNAVRKIKSAVLRAIKEGKKLTTKKYGLRTRKGVYYIRDCACPIGCYLADKPSGQPTLGICHDASRSLGTSESWVYSFLGAYDGDKYFDIDEPGSKEGLVVRAWAEKNGFLK